MRRDLNTLQPAEVKTAIQIGMDTGRRPEDILDLPLDCLAHDKDGAAVLVYDNAKANRLGRRLPISEATATVITAQQDAVRRRFPDTPTSQLNTAALPTRQPRREQGQSASTCSAVATANGSAASASSPQPDNRVFDTSKIIPYAYRHTYAQRHAERRRAHKMYWPNSLIHRNLNVTRRYYRIGSDRRRDAVDKVTAMSFDRHGNRVWRDAQALLESEHARYAIGQARIFLFGTCTEPSNVQAGGGACPVRYRCAGCDHFRTDVSHLPDLTAHLDDLLRTRERLAAALTALTTGPDETPFPANEEITRIRRLIRPGRKVTSPYCPKWNVTRSMTPSRPCARHRATHTVNLGMPARATRAHTADHDRLGGHRMSTTGVDRPGAGELTGTSDRLRAAEADSARRRQRVLAALNQATATGVEISVSGIARAAGVDRTFLYRHPDLLAQLHALEATPPATGNTTGPSVTRASLRSRPARRTRTQHPAAAVGQ